MDAQSPELIFISCRRSIAGVQYGDYNGLTGHAGIFYPSWTDRQSGGREEIWTVPIRAVP